MSATRDTPKLPAGARPPRRPVKEYQEKPEVHVGAEGGALQRLAALYQPASGTAAAELGEPLKPHADLYTDCPGMLRELDRDEILVCARCDVCGHETSFKPEVVDQALRVQGILRRAGLPARFVDEPLPPAPGTKAARDHLSEVLAHWGTPDAPRPPFLVGPFGRGKTHLLTRAARQLVEQHEVRLRYVTWADLVDEAKAAMDAKGRDRNADTVTVVFERAARVDLLVLDDLKPLASVWQQETLEQLVDRRYRGRPSDRYDVVLADTLIGLPIMGSTNVPLPKWPTAFGPRVASRLLELTHPVAVDGPDWRQQ